MLDTPQQWDPCGFRDNKWDPCGFEDFYIGNVTLHQSKAVDATALPAKSLLSTIPLSPSSALPSPSTSEASGSTVRSATKKVTIIEFPQPSRKAPVPSDDTERPAGFFLNIQKQSFPEVMKPDFTQPNRKYHELTTHELKECARRRCLPQIDEMSRNGLMENLRIVDGWYARTLPRLAALAKEHGCPVRPGSTHESLLIDMMNYSVGNRKAAVAAFSELTGTTSTDIANNTTPAHSAQRSDDTFAAEVRRLLEAKSNREVLGFALGERSTLQKATSLYKKLALRIHSDKRTETGIAKAGGLQACDRAWTRLTEARQWAERVLKEGTRIAAAPPHPPPPAAPPPTAGMSVARPPEPEGTKAPRPFGWGPLDPLPPPHPNFGALRVVVVD